MYLERIGRVYPRLNRELQLHRSLSFETHPLPKADQRGNGVEQPSRTRRDRRIKTSCQHPPDHPQLIFGEIADWRKIHAPQRVVTPNFKQNAQGGSVA